MSLNLAILEFLKSFINEKRASICQTYKLRCKATVHIVAKLVLLISFL